MQHDVLEPGDPRKALARVDAEWVKTLNLPACEAARPIILAAYWKRNAQTQPIFNILHFRVNHVVVVFNLCF